MSVQVSGGFRKLDPNQLKTAMDRSLTTVGILLEGEVISRANENVKTGRHKGSITWQKASEGSDIRADRHGKLWPEDEQTSPTERDEVHVGTAVHYAPHLEYGHKTRNGGFVQAYPHFRKAFDENIGRVRNLFQTSFRSFVKRAKHNS